MGEQSYRAVGPRAGLFRQALGAWLVLAACLLPLALLGVMWLAGRAAAALSGQGWSGPDYDLAFARQLVRHGPAAVWPGTPAALVWVLAALLAAALCAAVAVPAWRRAAGPTPSDPLPSLAQPADVAALAPAGAAARALALRPQLRERRSAEAAERRRLPGRRVRLAVDPRDAGIVVGQLRRPRRRRGPVLRASWEDELLAIMGPRAGKTTALAITGLLHAPGPAVATSNKSDLWLATARLRAESTGQPVWTFDAQQITHSPRTWWWDPLAGVANREEAQRLAGHFMAELVAEGGRGTDPFFSASAEGLLTALLLAAGTTWGTLRDVCGWLTALSDPDPVDRLKAAGHAETANWLSAIQHYVAETRDGIYATAQAATQCLQDRRIMEWVTPPPVSLAKRRRRRGQPRLARFDAAAFVESRQTLFLLSKDGAGAAAPLVAAMTDRVLREAVRAAERRPAGRLDPPVVVVLDEAANVCKIKDLPLLYSHLGSRGICVLTILQSPKQGVLVWGEHGMVALWSAATVKLVGPGIDDPQALEDISRLVGEHDVTVRAVSYGGGGASESVSLRRQRILEPGKIRALKRPDARDGGEALLFTTGTPVVLLRLLPSYEGPDAADISAVSGAEGAALASRAGQVTSL